MLKNQSLIKPDFPNPHRLSGTPVFRELMGDMASSTFARKLKEGSIPAPDKKIGPLNMWYETTMAATAAALPTERLIKSRPPKSPSTEARAVA